MIQLTSFLFCILLSSVVRAQDDRLNEYLNALQTKDSETSKDIIDRTSFHLTNEYTLYSFEKLAGEYFDTDVNGIKGYKASIAAIAIDGDQNKITDTFLAVMYYDHREALWKVFDFRTKADPCYEAAVSQSDIDKDKFYTDKEYVYRNLGYWQMMCGNIARAENAFRLASVEAEAKGMPDFVKEHMETIKRIR
jgi:hypothetical protein